MSPVLSIRQDDDVDIERPDQFDRNWWYSSTATTVKWSVLGGLLGILVLYFVLGYWHAKRRVAKGLPLLKYHRILIPKEYRRRAQQPTQNNYAFYRVEDPGYPMGNMNAPPPIYDPNAPMPPTYQPQPPNGAFSKIAPNQVYDLPPPGNPPPSNSPPSYGDELPPRPAKDSNSVKDKATKLLGKFGRK